MMFLQLLHQKKASGQNKRPKVEAAIGRWKQVTGDGLRSGMEERRVTEVNVAVDVLTRMLDLGRPNYVRIVWPEWARGRCVQAVDPGTTLSPANIIRPV